MAKRTPAADESKLDPAAILAALNEAHETKSYLKPKKADVLLQFKDAIGRLVKDGASAAAVAAVIHKTGYKIPESSVRLFIKTHWPTSTSAAADGAAAPAPAPARSGKTTAAS